MRFLDLFCGAGGAAVGMHRAYPDAEIIGIDNRMQKHYPFTFVLGDALNPPFDLSQFDFIWASPVCQRYSEATPPERRNLHPDLITPVREMLITSGRPYAIENVEAARRLLRNPLMLCGTMFGMNLYRHRYFEVFGWDNPFSPACCRHSPNPVLWTGMGGRTKKGRRPRQSMKRKRSEGGIDWMTGAELTLAIPPAYSEYILKQLRLT